MDGQLRLFAEPEDGPEEVAQECSRDPLQDLRGRFERGLERRTLGDVVLTDNRSTILSSREDGSGRVDVRLHWSFATASDAVLLAAARIVEGIDVRRSRHAVREWVREHGERVVPKPLEELTVGAPRRSVAPLEPTGRVHDLAAIRDEVDSRYFAGRHPVAIGWSRAVRPARRRRTRRQTIQLGSWSADERRVLVHPVLDHRSVPRFVVAAVVHHELLHADMDPVVSNGRRRLHTPEFRRRERQFEHYEAARRWIDRHLGSLLRRRAQLRSRESAS